MSKEKVHNPVKFSCLQKDQYMRYKLPHTTHMLEFLILSQIFYTDYPDGVGDTSNIFVFP